MLAQVLYNCFAVAATQASKVHTVVLYCMQILDLELIVPLTLSELDCSVVSN
jgi:hypothetical protein